MVSARRAYISHPEKEMRCRMNSSMEIHKIYNALTLHFHNKFQEYSRTTHETVNIVWNHTAIAGKTQSNGKKVNKIKCHNRFNAFRFDDARWHFLALFSTFIVGQKWSWTSTLEKSAIRNRKKMHLYSHRLRIDRVFEREPKSSGYRLTIANNISYHILINNFMWNTHSHSNLFDRTPSATASNRHSNASADSERRFAPNGQ